MQRIYDYQIFTCAIIQKEGVIFVKYSKNISLVIFLSIFFLLVISVKSYADTEPCSIISPRIKDLLKPFELYVKLVPGKDLDKLILQNKALCEILKNLQKRSYVEKDDTPYVIASYIALYTIGDLAYIFVTSEREIKPVYKNAWESLFKGSDPNYLAFSYKDGYVKENEKIYKNVDFIKIEKEEKAIIVSRDGFVLKVEDFELLAPGNYFYYTSFNPITKEFNKMKVSISKIKYIIFSPYYEKENK